MAVPCAFPYSCSTRMLASTRRAEIQRSTATFTSAKAMPMTVSRASYQNISRA